jgi:hypothetical protein
MLKISNEPTEAKCPRCRHYQKQNARLKRAFIEADDESVRRSMKYEYKILELIAELVWLKAEDSSRGSKRQYGVKRWRDHSNTNPGISTSINCEER